MVRIVREDNHLLTIKFDHMEIELHLLRTYIENALGQIKDRIEINFIEILAIIHCLALVITLAGPSDPSPSPPPMDLSSLAPIDPPVTADLLAYPLAPIANPSPSAPHFSY